MSCSVSVINDIDIFFTENDDVRRQLVSVIRTLNEQGSAADADRGARLLLTEMRDAASSPPALAFIAQSVKDVGDTRTAVALYERALQVAGPGNLNLALSLAHCYEVCAQPQQAFAVIKRCLATHLQTVIHAKYPTPSVSSSSSSSSSSSTPTMVVGQLSVRSVLEILRHITDVFDPALRLGTHKCTAWRAPPRPVDAGQCKVNVPNADASASSSSSSSSSSSTSSVGRLAARDQDGKPIDGSGAAFSESGPCTYTADELDLLALLFTVMKIMFTVGALQPLPALVELIGTALFVLYCHVFLSSFS